MDSGFRGSFRGRGSGFPFHPRGRGMMRGGMSSRGNGFGGPMRGNGFGGRGRGGPMRPPRGMGMGSSRGMNGGSMNGGRGSGRGRYPSSGPSQDYFSAPSQSSAPPNNNNQQPTPLSSQPENVNPEKNITSPSPVPQTNNVQVVSGNQQQQQQQQPTSQSPSSNPSMSSSRGAPRGRGNLSAPRGMGRGRGSFSQGPPRQSFDTRQPSNLTPTTTVAPIKRGGYQGNMAGPPKRGRYDQGPMSGNGGGNGGRYMGGQQPQASHHQQNSYNNVPAHSSYQDHSQYNADQYAHSGYNNSSMPPQNNYANNGYGQSYGNNTQQMGYQSTEYDASGGYQDYSASSYPAHDSRYTNYSQDYRQPYGTSTEYGTVAPDSSYSTGQYDRSYGNYGEYQSS
ncbi:unnamed protein product [Diamesa hyperborea]